jgi:regulator of protease activity HflC (stomatin/prohibitin superfamily)
MESIIQLLNSIKEFWHDIIFWYAVPEMQNVVVLRNGKFHRQAGPGLHFKLPCIFSFGDELHYVDTVTETTDTQPQTVTTKDNLQVVVSAIIKHKVIDPKVYIIEVMDVKSAIVDITMGKIKRNVMERTWDECINQGLDNEIAKQARSEAKKWGVYIEEVTIINLAQIKSVRLITNNSLL